MSYQTQSNEGPKCPNCLCHFDAVEDRGPELRYDTECPHCGQRVRVSVETAVTYYCGKIEG